MRKFKIIENKKNQRILLIDDHYLIFEDISVKHNEFDAMMFLSEDGNLVERQFLHLNPLTNKTFYLKPFFVNPGILNAPFLKCAADGLSSDINEPLVINKIENIKQNIKELNIEIKNVDLKKTDEIILITIFRLFLSRGVIPDPILKAGSTLGYCICFYEFCLKYNLLSFKSILLIYEEYMTNKYLKPIDTLDVVQYCKHCNHTHIIFTEICPKCSSCMIELSSMVHHFPCANISNEVSYMIKGALVCPKCKKELRHIGVDYDRPAGVYNCIICNSNFSRANMRGTCVSCKRVLALDQLKTFKIYSLEFTEIGAMRFAKWDIYNLNEDLSVAAGFLSFNAFMEYIKNEIEIYNLSVNNNKLTVIRIKGIPLSDVEILAQFIFDNLENAKCTFKENIIYIAINYTDESEIENYSKLLDKKAKTFSFEQYVGVDYTNYSKSITIDDYLKQIL